MTAGPSQRQLEKHIRLSAADSAHVVLTNHARLRMNQRRITMPMLMEALQRGVLTRPPEPEARRPGLRCQMQHFVAGVNLAAVVYVEYPAPELVVVTVIDVGGA